MKLLTPQIAERLSEVPLYKTDGMKIREVIAVFFHLFSSWAWYVVEAEQQPDGDWLMFCYCRSGLGPDCNEWGYVLLSQLEEVSNIRGFAPKNYQIKQDGKLLF